MTVATADPTETTARPAPRIHLSPANAAAPTETLTSAEHPSMPIPFEMFIDNRRFQGTGLSVVSGTAQGLPQRDMDGRRTLAMLQFIFDGFTVSLEAEVTLHVAASSDLNMLAFSFTDPTGPHLPQLRNIMNSYIAGDLVNLGSVLHPSSDARNGPKAHMRANPVMRVLGGLTRGAVTLGLTVGLVWGALSLVENRVLTVTEARPAIVNLPGEVLRAPSSGQIDYINATAGKGEVAFSILSNAGIVLSLKMPCDCEIADLATFEGATILAGEPVMQLADADSAPVIRAQLSEDSLSAIVSGYTIALVTPDGLEIPARLGAHAAREIAASAQSGPISVTLDPATPLPSSAAGMLMTVRLSRPGMISTSDISGWFAGLYRNAVQSRDIRLAAGNN